MDADDIDEALSDLGLSSIPSSPPAEEPADGGNAAASIPACNGVPPGASPANNNNTVATNNNNTGPRVSAADHAADNQGQANQPARHR